VDELFSVAVIGTRSLSFHEPPSRSTATRSSILERYRDKITRCVRCGTCKRSAPHFSRTANESLSARGGWRSSKRSWRGDFVSALYRDRLETCTSCLACEAHVPARAVTEIIQAAKEEAVRLEGRGSSRLVSASLADERLMRGLAWLAPLFCTMREGGEGRVL